MKSPRSSVLLLVLALHLEVHGEPEAAPRARSPGADIGDAVTEILNDLPGHENKIMLCVYFCVWSRIATAACDHAEVPETRGPC